MYIRIILKYFEKYKHSGIIIIIFFFSKAPGMFLTSTHV